MAFRVLVAITLVSSLDGLLLQSPPNQQFKMTDNPMNNIMMQMMGGSADGKKNPFFFKGAHSDQEQLLQQMKTSFNKLKQPAAWMERKPTIQLMRKWAQNPEEIQSWMKYKPSPKEMAEFNLGPKTQVTPPAIRPGTGVPLKSGDQFALESEVEPGLFVTHRKLRDMGYPEDWNEFKHITHAEFGLKKGMSENSTFVFENKQKDEIKSSDSVKWIQDGMQLDNLLSFSRLNGGSQGFMWPHPLVLKEKSSEEAPDFVVEHAREIVDWDNTFGKPGYFGYDGNDAHKGWGWAEEWMTDPNKGKVIKDGDSVWIKHHGDGPADNHGFFYYMTGDPAEGGHVSFPHHYPGFDGHVKNYRDLEWLNVNDPHATSSRFTIRKI